MKHLVAVMVAVLATAGPLRAQQTVLPGGVEAISLLGDSLFRPVLPPATEARFRQQLVDAEADLATRPGSADATIWVGRRLGYLGHFREAIAVFSRGVSEHPNDARFYRHRGHRYITVRRFDRAIDDLLYAVTLTRNRPDVVEPDGAPNARNIPVSSLQSNIRYHLALAYYLKADFRNAARWWGEDLRRARNNDTRVAAGYWLYLSLRRMGQSAPRTGPCRTPRSATGWARGTGSTGGVTRRCRPGAAFFPPGPGPASGMSRQRRTWRGGGDGGNGR
ncbi:MAG: Tetratricopeptide 2 repeat-containing protein [Gemmatimonadetes bacterium]|nr:Tetratricopeptide 2 repeat-containing protein [Gemmatimonadota bacterium]